MKSSIMSKRAKMEKIFSRENQVLLTAENLINSNQFDSDGDAEKFKSLYNEYQTLLRQTTKVVRLADRIQLELKTVTKELEDASQIDALTGLYNRMYFMKKCLTEYKSAIRTGNTFSLLMFDIDFFKEYNDTYGHIKGDECLRAISSQIVRGLNRPRDVIARYGGDEFVIILPETGTDGAMAVTQKILEAVRLLNLEHKGSKLFGFVTLSIGVTALYSAQDTMEMLFQQADQVLYAAKKKGRNCAVLYTPESPQV